MTTHRRNRRAVALAAALSFAGLLAGCIGVPRPVAGIPADANWIALPLSGWIAEGDITIDAVSFCSNASACPEGTVVAALEAKAEAANALEKALEDPDRMARLLNEAAIRRARGTNAGRETKPAAPTTALARRVTISQRPAIAVDILRGDGSRSASAIVAGRRDGEILRAVLVIARTADAATGTARDVISARLAGR